MRAIYNPTDRPFEIIVDGFMMEFPSDQIVNVPDAAVPFILEQVSLLKVVGVGPDETIVPPPVSAPEVNPAPAAVPGPLPKEPGLTATPPGPTAVGESAFGEMLLGKEPVEDEGKSEEQKKFEKQIGGDDQQFVCATCDKEYTNHMWYRKHLATHA